MIKDRVRGGSTKSKCVHDLIPTYEPKGDTVWGVSENLTEYNRVLLASSLPRTEIMSILVHIGSMGLKKRHSKPSRERKLLIPLPGAPKGNGTEVNETTKKSNSGYVF